MLEGQFKAVPAERDIKPFSSVDPHQCLEEVWMNSVTVSHHFLNLNEKKFLKSADFPTKSKNNVLENILYFPLFSEVLLYLKDKGRNVLVDQCFPTLVFQIYHHACFPALSALLVQSARMRWHLSQLIRELENRRARRSRGPIRMWFLQDPRQHGGKQADMLTTCQSQRVIKSSQLVPNGLCWELLRQLLKELTSVT